MAASGGIGSYTYSIVSGPVYPNISYPITLPSLVNAFSNLPRGQYSIKVIDAVGNFSFATATVAGSYTFPVISPIADTIYSTCITVSEVGGRPPFRYSCSSVETNTGFGSYQSSNSFCHLCNGNYWIRVLDSCSNIYTTNRITVIVPIPQYAVTYASVGHTDSIHIAVTTAGAAPYSYHLSGTGVSLTNSTGIFRIPVSCSSDMITITDSCGRVFQTTTDIHALHAIANS